MLTDCTFKSKTIKTFMGLTLFEKAYVEANSKTETSHDYFNVL